MMGYEWDAMGYYAKDNVLRSVIVVSVAWKDEKFKKMKKGGPKFSPPFYLS